jgi:hypothetical protein
MSLFKRNKEKEESKDTDKTKKDSALRKDTPQDKKQKAPKEDKQKAEPEPLLPGLKDKSTEDLLALLLQTKKGLFGDPGKKLKKDISKRLGIPDDDTLERGALLAYSRLPKVQKALSKLIQKQARDAEKAAEKKAKEAKKQTEKEAKEAEKAAKKKAKEAEKAAKKKAKEAEKAAKKQAKEAEKADKSPEDGAKAPEGQPGETGKTVKPEEPEQPDELKPKKSELKIVEKRTAPKDLKALAKAPSLSPGPLGPNASERMRRIDALLEEQRRLEEEEQKRKSKKKRNIRNPFSIVGQAIGKALHLPIKAGITVISLIAAIPINFGKLVTRAIGGFLQGTYHRVGGVSPFGWKKKINQLVIYSGVNKTQEEITGITIINGVVLATFIALMGFFFMGWDIIITIVASVMAFASVWMIAYTLLNLMAEKRSEEVESTLPDVLQIVSANISAGMTPYNALWVSARKEFGALAEEIKIAQRETLGGKPFANSLSDMGRRVKSNVLQRTIRLLIQGMKAGGELPQILQGIATDIRQMKLLQKEMAANTMSYVLFILFGMILGAPLLFSVSIQFVDIMNRFQPEGFDTEMIEDISSNPAMGGMQGFNVLSLGGGGCPKDFDADGIPDAWEKQHGLNAKNSSDAHSVNSETGEKYIDEYNEAAEPLPASCITPQYLSTFAMMALFSIAFFGSLLIGLIRDGKQSAGIKLMPLLIPATLGMFTLMNAGMSFFFGSMFIGV